MLHHTNYLKYFLLLISFLGSLFSDYEEGKTVFLNKCSQCHGKHIDVNLLKENFFEKNNTILNLKAPSVNMLVYALKNGPKHLGEKDDEDMQKVEIEEFLQEYLYNPKIENSVCDPIVVKYYKTKESLKGKVTKEEITSVTDYLFDYHKMRKKVKKKVKKLSSPKEISSILKLANDENKKVIIKATSKSCYFCKKMDKEVLSLETIQQKIDEKFIMVEVDVEESLLPLKLNSVYEGMTPTFFILDSNGGLLNQYAGAWNEKDFLLILKENN